ncbi:hypothetical protein V5046_06540 [Moellerella wisconsensis]|uniref:hypothetical protein n=1 Tax=Moellerella wisconsensis TaxID=158849 RepID=UPI003076000D
MYQDTYIEYWGEIFVSARIIEFGITFERFLKDPWKHLMSCGQESAPDAIAEGMLPLLPAQAEVARRVREMSINNKYDNTALSVYSEKIIKIMNYKFTAP